MRKFLFRGKLSCNGKWVEGDLLQYITMTIIQCMDETERTVRYEKHLVETSTVGQFTGLTDNNSKRIFEGDIIRCVCFSNEHIYVVVWDRDEYGFKATNGKANYGSCFAYLGNCEEIEIIGNIHDNPELLEGGGEDDGKQ